MLNRIVQFSLRFPGLIAALALLLLVYGGYVAGRARMDVFPEFAPPMVVVQTEAPGLSPEQVELLVTRPVESAINGAAKLVSLRSQSIQGLSVVIATFADDADLFASRLAIGERLSIAAEALPDGVQAPRMAPMTSSTSLTLVIGLTSANLTPMELRTFADWTVRPRLLGSAGVAKVEIFGGEVRQLQIQVRPERLVAFNLSMQDVLGAARHATTLHGAGFVETPNQRIVVRATGQPVSAEQVARVIVAHHSGQAVRLGDLAWVRYGAEPKYGDALVQGEPGVVLLAYSQYGANTMAVTASLERALDELQPAIDREGVALDRQIFRPATFIERSLANIRESMWVGGALVLAVLFLFLLDARTALISFLSIPLSLLAGVIVLDHFGASLNTLTLGGFAIAIGVVVDDAIIDVENILRRLRQNQALSSPRPLDDVILRASLEVRGSIVYATFIVALVFLPVLGMTGIQGKLFAPLGVAFILATLASLGVALTVTPALCYLLLSRVGPHVEPRYVGWIKRGHAGLLRRLLAWPRTVMAGAAVLCVAAGALLPGFGGEFLPEFREGHYVIHMLTAPGTSLEESTRLGRRVSRALLANRHVRSVNQQAGRAEDGEDTWGTHTSELHTDLHALKGEEVEVAEREIRAILDGFPGAVFSVHPFLVERMEETISGTTAEIVVNIFGNDLEELDRVAGRVQTLMRSVPGAADVRGESYAETPEIVFRLRQDQLTRFGFHPDAVLETVQVCYQGVQVAQINESSRVFDVVVALDPRQRREPEFIGALVLRNAEGLRLPLNQLAEIYQGSGRQMIAREGAMRRQQVTGNVEGRDTASFLAELKTTLAREMELPAGVHLGFSGSSETQRVARRELAVQSVAAGAGIVLLLFLVFRRGRHVLLLLANLPFALAGGAVAVLWTGGIVSIGSLVGFITLFGISMRNSIMLLSHCEHLVTQEGAAWTAETAWRAATERLVPILMTALVTGLALLPLALGRHQAGREVEGPMAVVILGGLLTSTILNLLVLPVLALKFARFSRGAGSDARAPFPPPNPA